MNKPIESPKADPAEILRHEAIDRYLRGEKAQSHLYSHRTKPPLVLYHFEAVWSGHRDGLRIKSRAPHQVHNRTPAEVEAAIVRVRQTITSGQDPELRYVNIGAKTIAFELERINR